MRRQRCSQGVAGQGITLIFRLMQRQHWSACSRSVPQTVLRHEDDGCGLCVEIFGGDSRVFWGVGVDPSFTFRRPLSAFAVARSAGPCT